MTKTEFVTLQNDAYHLALDIGVRPAARALGLHEDRLRKWSSRLKWNIAAISNGVTRARAEPSPNVTAIEVKRKLLAQHSDRTRLGLAQAGSKVSEHLADLDAPALIKPAAAISAQQWSQVGDRVHGWSAERAKAPQVQVAVVNLPSDAERAERASIDAKLDAIAARLRAP